MLSCTVWAADLRDLHKLLPDKAGQHLLRPEWYDDPQGQRTGIPKTNYFETGLGWQHWFSPQIEFRPEVGYWRSFDTKAFNGNPIAGIAANTNYTVLGAMDVIIHF